LTVNNLAASDERTGERSRTVRFEFPKSATAANSAIGGKYFGGSSFVG